MDRWYPDNIKAGSIDDYLTDLSDPAYTSGHIRGLQQLFAGRDRKLLKFAEFGVWKGATTGQLARFLNSEGELHLFDYEDTVVELKKSWLRQNIQTLRHGVVRTAILTRTIGACG
jgi:hypothetical protein